MKDQEKRKGNIFWLELDDNGYYGIGPHSNDCNREIPSQIAPKRLKPGEKIRVRIVEE